MSRRGFIYLYWGKGVLGRWYRICKGFEVVMSWEVKVFSEGESERLEVRGRMV